MVTSKAGVSVGNHLAYSAVAEDSGTVHVGTADIVELERIDGLDTFKIVNNFNKTKTIENITPTGQIVRTKDLFNGVETRLVGTQSEAAGGLPVPKEAIKTLFGRSPGDSFPGPESKLTDKMPTKSDLPKGLSVPPGKGSRPGK